jgi:GT2 family glycosyltransferase
VPASLRAVAARLRPGSRERAGYEEFCREVEPVLAAQPRVHRFAVPPLIGERRTPAVEMAVCVDPAGAGNPALTHASLDRQTVAPAQVLAVPPHEALNASRAGWMVIVRAGDRLAPTALERLGQAVTLAPEAAVLTCDSDRLAHGGRAHPRCGPGPSPDGALACDRAGPPVAVARERAAALGLAPGPAWEIELLLALAAPDASGHAHVPQFLIGRAAREAADDDALVAAVERTLLRQGEGLARVELTAPGRRRVRWQPRGEPSVDAIVCFRDRPELLERCATSLLERSTYERLRLRLVDNGSSDPRVGELLARLRRDRRVSVTRDRRPFNFAALNNRAASDSWADFLVFLNSDTEVTTPGWIEGLLEEAQREEVGAVAPLLVYPDGRVQFAGAALGLQGFAGHPFAGLAPDQGTPFGSAADGTRNWLAVTAACMMVKRRKFEAVGGFDESFAVGGNDVDLCLRLTEAGHRSLCVPDVRLLHDESASRDPRDIPARDFERSRERYGKFRTVGDPFYNPNLTLADTTCSMRRPEEVGA